jgi:predicted nucleic acid-binding protein
MKKYANRPMDLADAALLRVAEREGIGKIFTVDRRDFSVYRLHGRIRPALLP